MYDWQSYGYRSVDDKADGPTMADGLQTMAEKRDGQNGHTPALDYYQNGYTLCGPMWTIMTPGGGHGLL